MHSYLYGHRQSLSLSRLAGEGQCSTRGVVVVVVAVTVVVHAPHVSWHMDRAVVPCSLSTVQRSAAYMLHHVPRLSSQGPCVMVDVDVVVVLHAPQE